MLLLELKQLMHVMLKLIESTLYLETVEAQHDLSVLQPLLTMLVSPCFALGSLSRALVLMNRSLLLLRSTFREMSLALFRLNVIVMDI